ncbi:hypothetical protein C8Q80DRAFT_451958 [Daedaleopsis nitida]|nr:hypothetical protein C8Q80DRAFT_451958 [Daedaleopsis nitida]
MTSPAEAEATISSIKIKEALACSLIGALLGTARRLKGLVGLLFTLDSATSVLISAGIYEYVVTDFNGPNDSKILVGTITILSIGALGPAMALTGMVWAACDIISAGLCYYLKVGRSDCTRSAASVIDRLIVYALERAALTAICQPCLIATVSFRNRFYFFPFAFVQSKLYCNTLLATLNVRDSLRSGWNNPTTLDRQSIRFARGFDPRMSTFEISSIPTILEPVHAYMRTPREKDNESKA